MSYPVLRVSSESDYVYKTLKNLIQMVNKLTNLLSPEVVHVQVTSSAAATIPVDVYYVKTGEQIHISIMPFSFVCEAQHWLNVTIPDIKLPVNGLPRNFPFVLLTGSTRNVSVISVDTSGGGCTLDFCSNTSESRMLPGTSYSTDYVISISFMLI